MDSSPIPFQDWFLCKQDAATAYLKEILKEVRWKVTDDPFFDQFGLAERGTLVRIIKGLEAGPHYCDCGCRGFYPRCTRKMRPVHRCAFRFEMDRGRRGYGHEYVIELEPNGGIRLYRLGFPLRDVVLEGDQNSVSPESLLDALRELVVWDVMDA